MNFWNNFAAKHPAAAKWVREGGLFVIVSNLITVFKYLLLQFLPSAFGRRIYLRHDTCSALVSRF